MKINKKTEKYFTYRNQLSVWKSEKYLAWMKSKYPQMDLHHIIGSVHGLKLADLVVPIDHKFHLEKVEKNKAHYFDMFFPISILHLKLYADMIKLPKIQIDALSKEPEPKELNEFFTKLQSQEILFFNKKEKRK